MKTIIKSIPIPIAGLMLALATTGNLVAAYSVGAKYILGSISGLIFILLVLKLAVYPKQVLEGLNNPVIASVAPTFSMGLMVLSTYLKPSAPQLAYLLWWLAIAVHALLMLVFFKKYILNFNINKVFASYFIVFVGIVVASVTAPAHQMLTVGQYICYFGIFSFFILLPFVLYRVYIVKQIPEPAIPTIAIMTAPANLCLAGYLSSFPEKNITLVYILMFFSVLTAILALLKVPQILRLKFYPSYSALTFPFAITAVAFKKLSAFFNGANIQMVWLSTVADLLVFWAIAIVVYVTLRYFIFLVSKKEMSLAG